MYVYMYMYIMYVCISDMFIYTYIATTLSWRNQWM